MHIGMHFSCCLGAKSCLTLCNPTDSSSPGSSVPGISQARILEWDAISFSRGSSWPREDIHWQVNSLPLSHHGSLHFSLGKYKLKTTMKHFYRLINSKRKAWLTIPSAGKDIEQIELSYTADRSVNWWNHFGNLF